VETILASYRYFSLRQPVTHCSSLSRKRCERFANIAAQSQALRQISSTINSSAFFVDVILHYQITALARKCGKTIVQATQTLFFLFYFASVERNRFMLDFIKRRTADSKTAKLTLLNSLPTREIDPAYASVEHSGRNLMIANYGSNKGDGCVSVFPLKPDGSLADA
jgi:hypothetical protein